MTRGQKAAFLAELAETGNLAFACCAADVTLAQAFDARAESPGFERQWRNAQSQARSKMLGRVRDHV
jgi:hypothetical protein